MATSAPTMNRAIIYADPPTTKMEIVELEIPQPKVGQVLVRMYVK